MCSAFLLLLSLMVFSTAMLTQLHAWCSQMQPPPHQGYQQHAQTVPRVEEVPLDAPGSGNAGAAAAGPIVEEPGWFACTVVPAA